MGRVMGALLNIAAVAIAGFHRCGRFWPHEGIVVDPGTLEPAVLARLRAEPQLHITPATGAAVEAAQAEDLRQQVKTVLGALEAVDFADDGTPKLAAVKKALPKGTPGVTADLVTEVWAGLKPPE